MATIRVVKWLSADVSQLLEWNRHGVLSALSFTGSDSVCYFDRLLLSKAVDIEGVNRGK